MTLSTTKSLLDRMLAGASASHPHLSSPVNSHAIARERVTAIQGLEGLMAYQRFLADARSVKAQRRHVSKDFERHVQTQSRHALAELDAFNSSALRTAGQVNQTEYWRASLQRIAAALNDTGPVMAQDLWRDIRGRSDVTSMLARLGFSDSMAAVSDQAIAATNAVVRMGQGRVEIATRPQGSDEELHISLAATHGRPKTVTELLGRASFGQFATAISRPGEISLPAISTTSPQFEPGELVALAAFASRQLLVNHVRKLEDTGLATHAGGEPGTLTVLLVIGLTLFLTGLWIGDMCTDPQVINPPSDAVCTAGGLLTLLGILLIFVAVPGLIIHGGLAASGASFTALSLSTQLILVGGATFVGSILALTLHFNASLAGAYDAAMGFSAPNLAEDEPS